MYIYTYIHIHIYTYMYITVAFPTKGALQGSSQAVPEGTSEGRVTILYIIINIIIIIEFEYPN